MTRIEWAALSWVIAKREAARLKTERARCRCEVQEPDEPEVGWSGHEACFKDFCVTTGGDYEDLPKTRPVSEWCPSCQRRQIIHLQYRAATKARGIANRALQRLCAAELKRQAKQEETQ